MSSFEKYEKLEKLHEKQNELRTKLKYSLLIQSVWPEAFKHGQVICYFKGGNFMCGDRHKDIKFCIRNGEGTEKEFDILVNVPIDLVERQVEVQKKTANEYQCEAWDGFMRWVRRMKRIKGVKI